MVDYWLDDPYDSVNCVGGITGNVPVAQSKLDADALMEMLF